MNRTTIAAIVASSLAAGQGTAAAQDSEAIQRIRNRVEVGETISVLDTNGGRIVGTYLGATPSAVKLEGTQDINGKSIARVTKKDSTRNGTTIGAIIGAGAGAVGALLVGAICANEGGECMGATLGLVGLGVGAGAGIGWFSDALVEHEIYRAEGAPRSLSPEVRVRLAADKRATVTPAFGLSWSMTRDSGLGLEVNFDHLAGAPNGNDRGYSVDGRALYTFGHSRVRPYVSGGIAHVRRSEDYRFEYPPSLVFPNGAIFAGRGQVEGFTPVFGGGVRIQTGSHLVIRPELSWLGDPGNNPSHHAGNVRVGASIGASW